MKGHKSFFVGVAWTVFYVLFVGCLGLFLPYTPFRIGTLNPFIDWIRLIEDFVNDELIIDTGKELLTVLVFIGFWPVWGWGWRRCLRWFKKEASVVLAPSKIVIKKHTMERPPMASAPVSFTRPADYMEGKAEYETITAGTTPDEAEEAEQQPNAVDMTTLLPKIREIVQGTDMDIFEDVLLGEVKVPVVVASDTRAYLLTFLGTNQEWVADEDATEEGEAPTWFCSEGLIPSPFYQMKQAAEVLQKQESDSTIIPVVVVLNGEVLNYETMTDVWKEQGGYVVRFENGQPDTMMTLDALLNEKN